MQAFLDASNLDWIRQADFAVDAIDTVTSKLDFVEACHQYGVPFVCSLGMGTFFGLAFKKYGHPVAAIVIGEFIISMMFAGFVALGMPVTINNVVTGATLLAIICITTKRVKGAVVK